MGDVGLKSGREKYIEVEKEALEREMDGKCTESAHPSFQTSLQVFGCFCGIVSFRSCGF